jgi:hypothetical protein
MIVRRNQRADRDLSDVLFRIKRGLAGYVSYLAACEMNQAFSEYVLCEPILRILTARGYEVEREVKCPGLQKGKGPGDFKRIDFVAVRDDVRFAIEVEWAKSEHPNVKQDHIKLRSFYECDKTSRSFLCIFGKKSNLDNLSLKNPHFTERGDAVYADFRKTIFGCRMFELDQRPPRRQTRA